MKFECDSCGANYMIADEKVGKRGVKVKCKRCSYVIIVRPSEVEASAEAPPEPEASSPEPPAQTEGPSAEAESPAGGGVFASSEGQEDQDPGEVPAPPPGLDDATAVGEAPAFSAQGEGEDVALGSLAGHSDEPEADREEPGGVDATAGGGSPADLGDLGLDDDSEEETVATADKGEAEGGPDEGAADGDGPGADDATAVGSVPGWQMSGEQGDTRVGGAADATDPSAAGAAADADEKAGPRDPTGENAALDALAGLGGPTDDDDAAASGDDDADEEDVPAPPAMADDGAEGRDTIAEDAELPASDDGPGLDDVPAPPPAGAFAAGEGEEMPAAGGDAFDDQLAGAFNNMFGEIPSGDPDEVPAPPPFGGGDEEQFRGPTQVLDLNHMEHLRAQATPSDEGAANRGETADGIHPGLDETLSSLDGSLDTQQGEALAPWGDEETQMAGPEEPSWHVAIDDEDVGPLTVDEISAHIQAGRVDRDSLVWRSGMDDWEPAGDVDEISRLFESVPMPRIGPVDVGAPEGDLGGPPPIGDDPFDQVPDGNDPNWQPHGLTDVYQAANLAEAAGLGAQSGPTLGDTPSTEGGSSDDEWRPGAAGALAALVEDEIARIDTPPEEISSGGLAPADDAMGASLMAEGAGAGAEVGGLTSAPSSAALATGGLSGPSVSGPALSSPGVPMNGNGGNGQLGLSSPALSGAALPQVPSVDSYPPQPAMSGFAPVVGQPPASRSPLVYIVGTVAAIFLIVIGVALLKLAFFNEPSGPVVAQNEQPAGGAAGKAAADPAAEEPAKEAGEGDEVKAGEAKGDEASSENDEAPADGDGKDGEGKDGEGKNGDGKGGDGDKVAKADDEEDKAEEDQEKKVEKKKPTRVASRKKSSRVKKRTPKRRAKKRSYRSRRKEKDPPKRRSRARSSRSKSKKGCDPILDIDCDEKPKKARRSRKVKDKLSKSDILIVVKRKIGGVRACFRKNGVKSTVKMEWKILKSGRTSGVRVLTSKYAGTPMGRCMTNEIKRWKFPAYSGSAPPPIKFPFKP